METSIWRRPKAIAAGIVIGLLVASSVAVAAWLINGRGNGYGKGGRTQDMTTLEIASADLAGDLFPGSQGTLSIRVSNPNNYPVTVVEVHRDNGVAITTDNAGCPGSNLSWNGNRSSLSLGPVPANSQTTVELNNAITLAATAPNDCQGVRFTVPITLFGLQA